MHLKVETGVNRQGVTEQEIPAVLELLASAPGVRLAGVSSHFADIEDTTDHSFAQRQMERFDGYRRLLGAAGFPSLEAHMSCSAATLLWDRSHRDLARVGIAAYGIWPSRETLVSVRQGGRPEAAPAAGAALAGAPCRRCGRSPRERPWATGGPGRR